MNFVTPAGFRDVLVEEAAARERIAREVQACFADRGYLPIETPTLEVMDVMRAGGRVPGSPFKFFDARGDLLAMRPDVTLQVARMCATRFADCEGPLRFRYMQRVFREADGRMQAEAREMTQIGIECIGGAGAPADAEVVELLVEALELAGARGCRLALATVGVLRALLASCGASGAWREQVLDAYHRSNFVEFDRLTGEGAAEAGVPPVFAAAIRVLPRIRGGREAIDEVRALVSPLGCEDGLDAFAATFDLLSERGLADRLLVDFSVMSSFDYYTGIVFEAYASGLGSPLGAGGRYDNMIGSYGESRPAAGFAFFLEQAMAAASCCQSAQQLPLCHPERSAQQLPPCHPERSAQRGVEGSRVAPAESASGLTARTGSFDSGAPGASAQDDRGSVASVASAQDDEKDGAAIAGLASPKPLRIAVPKGSLNVDTVAALEEAGLDVTGLANPGRALIIRNPGVEYVIVRPTDAPAFVASGAADCGICGKDSLLEAERDVVELVDLGFGACRFVVAEPAGAAEATGEHYRRLGSIRVATKYPRITAAHYARTGIQAEIVKLHGNIELAPLTGMAERIVDITATGTTLRENDLVVVDEVLSSTARFFSNTCAFRTDARIVQLARTLARDAQAADGEERK